MISPEDILGMLDRAKLVAVGVKGLEGIVYLRVSPEIVRRKVDAIAGYGLTVEFGEGSCSDTLYIEAAQS